jgi:hypothetical protein
MRIFKHVQQNKALLRSNWLLAVAALLLAGAVYRVAASHLRAIVENPITLPVPLNSFPLRIDGWVGKNVPITETVQRVAGTDDFLNRLYVDKANNQWANVYVAYSARPRNMLGHRPQICYPAGGWIHDSTEQSQVISSAGRTIPCLVHRFHRPGGEHEETVVLNFYIVNGLVTTDESVFTGLGWRTPNIAGNPARYVAQVQISSLLENSVRRAAEEMTHLMLDFFPDETGEVRATEFHNITSGVLK